MALLDDVKLALRISNSSFDSEVNDLIGAAKQDIQLSGIIVNDYADPLAKRAVVVYCKAHFGFDNPDHERLKNVFQEIKTQMKLAGDYNAI